MCGSKATRTITVTNSDGLHARAATLVAELLRKFPAAVQIVKGTQRVDASNVLQVLSLGAAEGETLILEAAGEGADDALDALEQLFAGNFEEGEVSGNK